MVRATSLQKAVGFNQHVAAILQDFQKEYVWLDKEKSSLAIFLVDALAGICEVSQTHLMFALREAFLQKARRDSSVLAGVKFLGIELSRKSGAVVKAELRNNTDTAITLNSFSQFSVNGKAFYNPSGAVILPRSLLVMDLKQGTVNYKTFNLADMDLTFPTFNLGIPHHVVAADDIQITVKESNNVTYQWYKHNDSLYELPSDRRGYLENTTKDGDVNFLFGNGEFGMRLPNSGQLTVRYIVTEGIAGNIGSPGATVSLNQNSAVNGVTIEGAVGGSDEKDPNFYKLYGSKLFESRGTLIRPDHWNGLSSFPDVADIVVEGQKDLAPEDPSWMNTVRLCVLPINSSNWGGANPNPTSAQWTRFLNYVRERCGRHLTLVPHNPEKILIDVDIEVYVFDDVDAELMQTQITQAIRKFFTRRAGVLGRSLIPHSDLDRVVKRTEDGKEREGIDYIKINNPTMDVKPTSRIEYVSPRSINVRVKHTERKRETY